MSNLSNASDNHPIRPYPRLHITLTLWIWYWPVKLFLRLLARHQVDIQFDARELDSRRHYIIAANHQSLFDSLVVVSELSLPMWQQLHSFRFMGFRKLFANPLTRWLLISFGAFPTGPIARLPYGLTGAEKFLDEFQTVIMFPEGRRTSGPGNGVRDGIGLLANRPDTFIIPMHIEWTFGKRRIYHLTAGRPMKAAGMSAQEILDHIYALPVPR
jgi:1-acyl-sn-glycerol-3-phosphate acyltransferase